MTAMQTMPSVLIDLRRKPRPTDWTQQQVEELRRMAGHAPVAEIAATLGRTPVAVIVKAKQQRISLATSKPWRPWSASEVATLRTLRHTHTLQQVADILGRSLLSVTGKAREERIAYRKYGDAHRLAKYSRSTIAQVFRLRGQGIAQRHIADQVGLSPQYVSAILNCQLRYRETLQLDDNYAQQEEGKP